MTLLLRGDDALCDIVVDDCGYVYDILLLYICMTIIALMMLRCCCDIDDDDVRLR
jgi:hypothetical protein